LRLNIRGECWGSMTGKIWTLINKDSEPYAELTKDEMEYIYIKTKFFNRDTGELIQEHVRKNSMVSRHGQ